MSEKIIAKVKTGNLDKKELENLISNAERLGNTEVLEAAKFAIKKIDQKFHSKRFIKPIRDKIKTILEEIIRENGWGNWSDNGVQNGIKPGGKMLSGQVTAQYYVSYRHASWKKATYFLVIQRKESSILEYEVWTFDGEEITFEHADDAVQCFNDVVGPYV